MSKMEFYREAIKAGKTVRLDLLKMKKAGKAPSMEYFLVVVGGFPWNDVTMDEDALNLLLVLNDIATKSVERRVKELSE